jgi:ribosomal protein S18 acetylase RimI-like enzyme
VRVQKQVAETVEEVSVEEVTGSFDEVASALSHLIPQLSSSSDPPSTSDVEEMATSPATVLFVARETSGRIVGSLTLAVFRIPTGMRAWIEDVVVDTDARRRGIGELLVLAAVAKASEMGARTVDLTSRPSRQDANRLYLNLGFEARETNVYRFSAV